ncbi:hypothetical protein ACRAWF_03675 [Streptomyces sp. L7]
MNRQATSAISTDSGEAAAREGRARRDRRGDRCGRGHRRDALEENLAQADGIRAA